MCHDKKNSQLKNFLPLYSVLLIYSKFKASQILHGGTTPVAPSKNRIEAISIHLIRKTFPVFHIYLVVKKSQEKPCLPNWFPIYFPLVTEEIFSPATLVTEWTSIGYCKTSDFFLANVSKVRSPRWDSHIPYQWTKVQVNPLSFQCHLY